MPIRKDTFIVICTNRLSLDSRKWVAMMERILEITGKSSVWIQETRCGTVNNLCNLSMKTPTPTWAATVITNLDSLFLVNWKLLLPEVHPKTRNGWLRYANMQLSKQSGTHIYTGRCLFCCYYKYIKIVIIKNLNHTTLNDSLSVAQGISNVFIYIFSIGWQCKVFVFLPVVAC